jgi:DNA-directed RNA polymerase subunit beta'
VKLWSHCYAINRKRRSLTATFHVGGTASNVAIISKIEAKYDGFLEIDELRFVTYTNREGKTYDVVIGRSAEMRIVDPHTKIVLASGHIPYGANLYFKENTEVKKGSLISDWDPFNAVILAEVKGTIQYENIVEGKTYRIESDEQTGYVDKVVIEPRQKLKNPTINILSGDGEVSKSYDIPVGARIVVEDGQEIKAGEPLVKIPRAIGKTGDIGGLPG